MNNLFDILYESLSSVFIPTTFDNTKIVLATQWLTWIFILLALLLLIFIFLSILYWIYKQIFVLPQEKNVEHKSISIYHHKDKRR